MMDHQQQNGKPHVGHIETRVRKTKFTKYKI